MNKLMERLDGSYKLLRIKKLKLVLYITEIIMGLVIFGILGYMMDMGLEPFYIPFDIFILVITLIGVIIFGEEMYFSLIYVKYLKSKSGKHLVARNSIRKSVMIIAVFGLLATFLLLPSTSAMYHMKKNGFGGEKNIEVPAYTTRKDIIFVSSTEFGSGAMDKITLKSGYDLDVYLILAEEKDDPSKYANSWNTVKHIEAGSRLDIETDFSFAEKLALIVRNDGSQNATFTMTREYAPTNVLTLWIPVLSIIIVMIRLIAIGVFYPIREKYASESIYSKTYKKTKSAGYTELPDIKDAFDEALPAPPIEKAVKKEPSTTEKKIIPKKKGVIEEEEAVEVKCPSCGAMNIASSSLCFECGNMLTPAEESEDVMIIDTDEMVSKGKYFLKEGDLEGADNWFDKALEDEPENISALMGKGEVLLAKEEWINAVRYFNTIIETDGSNIEALLHKAEILTKNEKYDKARECCETIMVINPNHHLARTMLDELPKEEPQQEAGSMDDLLTIKGVGPSTAEQLYEKGFHTIKAVAEAEVSRISEIKGISLRGASKIVKEAKKLL